MQTWGDYYADTGDVPDALVERAVIEFAVRREKGLDLGAGNLRHASYLRASGFTQVLAVDKEAAAREIPHADGITLLIEDIRTFTPASQAFDFCVACNVFFFLSAADVAACMKKIYTCLTVDGLLACNVLGERDSWASRPNTASFSEDAFRTLCAPFTARLQEECEYDFPATETKRAKHWHIRRAILQK